MSEINPDFESLDTAVLISTPNPTRDNWRRILLAVQACQIIISSANKAKKSSLALATRASSLSSISYSVVNTNDTGEGDSKLTGTPNISPTVYQVVLDVNSEGADDHNVPQVVLDVNSEGADDQNGSNRKRQHANIARIVKAKDLVTPCNFGGVQGIAEALGTDLESGIHGDEDDLCSWRKAITPSKTQTPTQGFFGILFKSCNSYIIFLLLLAAVLSLGFGIKEEGTRTGWYEGVIIILVVVVLVLDALIRDCLHRRLQKPTEKSKMVVDVLRGGRQWQISISDVVLGDIVCLKRGHQVPADGLFISGEFLELDDSLESIDDQNPFMFYGSKVINGNGRMLVTCVGMNTVWGEMMDRVIFG